MDFGLLGVHGKVAWGLAAAENKNDLEYVLGLKMVVKIVLAMLMRRNDCVVSNIVIIVSNIFIIHCISTTPCSQTRNES